ncbi:MAG: GNAT family N-acetyltransferase [Lachnospiraceae bacterium]|nr:GNAT family N-acetyltransferase [Agathobacter sp.]MDD6292165.1 GNAT family N-acetyltransferase [Lachnospiraceae bacterium]
MQLSTLMYVEGEWSPSLLCQPLPSDITVAEVPAGNIEKNLRQVLAERGYAESEVLLIAATDRSVRAAESISVAVAGYSNPLLGGQTFAGVQMVIEGFEEVDFEFLRRIYERWHGIPWVIAQTERCLIRELSLEDLPALAQLYDQQGVTWRWNEKGERIPGYIEPLYPLEEEKDYQEAYISNMYGYYGYGMWLVTDRVSGMLIGRAGLEHREYDGKVELELGYLIAPQWQSRGIATEICRAILEYARQNLYFERVNALTDAGNVPSIALLERLGFEYIEDMDVTGRRMRRYIYIF